MFSLRKSLFSLASAAVLTLVAVCAQANTINVSAGQSIQAAINAANAGDTIVVAAGTYAESLDWENKDLVIQGAGAGKTIVDPSVGPGGRCLYTNYLTADSRIDGFTLQGGKSDSGGGMYNDLWSSPTVTNCAFTGNSATYGGGMLNFERGNMIVTNCAFTGNSASRGGGMYNLVGNPILTNCTFRSNSTTVVGGGIYNDDGCSPALTYCTFIDNSTTYAGGGMFNNSSCSPTLTNCTFRSNTATLTPYSTGGGMYNYSNCSPTLTDCAFTGNAATYGGGIYNYFFSSSPTLTNCTFSGNAAAAGGGMCTNASSSPTVTNCIFWGNAGGGMYNNFSHPTVTYTDDQDLSNTAPDAGGNFAADPLFVDAASGDLHLQYRSPCVNAGDNSVVTSPPFLMDPTNTFLIDLDGAPRIFGVSVDQGAYESQNPAPVANPGSRQTLEATGPTTSITLDGSASYDPQGGALSYSWDDGQGDTSTSVKPTFHLAVGAYIFTLAVTNPSGASDSQSVQVIVQDTTPPTISGASTNIKATATSVNGAVVTYAAPTAIDLVDGSVPVHCAPTSGSTFPLGTSAVTCTAADSHGNKATASFTVTVTYAWSGFLAPLNQDGSSVSKAGSTIPVKFQLTGASAGIANAVATLSYQQAGGSWVNACAFRYDPTGGQYICNWSTKGLSAGSYQLRVDLGDGALRTVNITLK